MISTSFLLSPSRRHNWLYRTAFLELKYPSLAPKLLLLCWGSNLILFLGRKEKKAVIENWPVLSRNTICFPSPQLAIKLDGFGSRAGTSHPKLKACIPRWSEVKSFDPALRTEELSCVSAPQSQTSTTQGGTETLWKGAVYSGRFRIVRGEAPRCCWWMGRVWIWALKWNMSSHQSVDPGSAFNSNVITFLRE